MTQGDIKVRALELWGVLRKPSCDDHQCVEMLFNALRNVGRELAEEERAKRLKAEAEVAELRQRLDMAPVASIVPQAELVL